jgi:sulfonate transport system permease protein
VTRRARRLALELVLPAALVALWWVLSADSESAYFPPLSENLTVFGETWFFESFTSDLLPSLIRFAAGFALAIVIGVLIGVALGLSPRARRDLQPVTEFFRAMPIAALVPAGLIVFGPGAKLEILTIAFAACWPILISTADGVRGVDPAMLDMARVYGVPRRERIMRVTLPAAMPRIVAGLRIALAIALATMVVANMIAGSHGLGAFIIEAQRTFDIESMWAGIIALGIIGYLFNAIFIAVQTHALAWHRGWRAATDGAA